MRSQPQLEHSEAMRSRRDDEAHVEVGTVDEHLVQRTDEGHRVVAHPAEVVVGERLAVDDQPIRPVSERAHMAPSVQQATGHGSCRLPGRRTPSLPQGRGRLASAISHGKALTTRTSANSASEGLLQPAGREEVDVLGVVAPPLDVLATAEVAEPEVRLPRHRDHAAAAGDAGQLGHRRLVLRQVLEQLDARDEVGAARSDRQHAGVGLHRFEPGEPIDGGLGLVEPVLEADRGVARRQHALERQALAHAHVDDGALDGAEHALEQAHPAAEQLLHDGVAGLVLLRVLAGGLLGGSGRQADGTAGGGSRHRRRSPSAVESSCRRRRRFTIELAEQAERHHLDGDHDQQHAELQGGAGADLVAEELGHAHPSQEQASPTNPMTKPMPPKRWNGRAV